MNGKRIVVALMCLLIVVSFPALAQKPAGSAAGSVDIPYAKHVLDNGLTVIIHEDHKAPIVAVNVWYHVGSKNEKPGKSGFAHLFEHLMFNGSENFNTDYFKAMERAGATDLNGTTSEDRTNYFQNVPTSAFDLALWMESDRMGHLLGVIDQAKLDEQRGVVQNEKRQGENQPYSVAYDLLTKGTWPVGHPYAHTVIGSMEDLNAASLDDVKEWFRTYYGPSNAVLAIAGDISTAQALEKVKTYFGDIPSGPPVARYDSWIAKRTGVTRQTVQDRVPQARLFKVWNVPGWGTEEATFLSLAANVLSSGKSSRLFKRLVYDDQIATSVSASVDPTEIGGQFYIDATVKPGGDIKKVERAIDEELAKFLKSGPTAEELVRVKTQYEAGFIRGIERVGGFGGKSDILAQNEVYGDSPDYYKTVLTWVKEATQKQVVGAATEWLSDGVYVLEVLPFPAYSTATADTTLRKSMPVPGVAPDAMFPAFQKTTLSNGMKVLFAQRASVPVVNFQMLFDAGYASDQFGSPGTARLAMDMMDEGTKTRTSLQISDELQLLGASIGTGADIDMCAVTLSALKANLDKSLALYADVILNPSFPKEDFERLQKQTIAGIQRERVDPNMMALRVLPGLLFGKDHAYGMPLTGSGYERTVGGLTRDDMVKYHQTWIKPNNATLIIVGDASLAELTPRLEKLFSGWKAGDVPKKNVSTVPPATANTVYILDKTGSQQSVIFAGNVIVPANNPQEVAIGAMNTVLGGAFTSRINMNLREDKHWSYGARTNILPTRAQRAFFAVGPVQSDKTKESVVEIGKEFREIVTTRPPTDDELAKAKSSLTLRLPGQWETNYAVMGSLGNIVRFGWPDDYYSTYAGKVKSLTVDDLSAAAKEVVRTAGTVWVIVGDRSKIEAGVKELNLGELRFLDADGNVTK